MRSLMARKGTTMGPENKRRNLLIVVGCVLLCVALVAGYFLLRDDRSPLEQNLTKTLETVFTLPNAPADALAEALNAKDLDMDAIQEKSIAHGDWLQESLAPYFTEKGFREASSDLSIVTMTFGGTDWTGKPEKIAFSAYSQDTTRFDLTLVCSKDREPQRTLELWGRAQGDEQGKITWFQLDGKSLQAMVDLMNQV